MFKSDDLSNHLATSHAIKTQSAVFAEWNLNQSENIARTGNYRFRPNSNNAKFKTINSKYDITDSGGYYTGATDADIVIDNGYDDDGTPSLFTTTKDKMKLLYSLEDCLKPFRPRSGINKLLYLGVPGAAYGYNQYIDDTTRYVARRPRYYMSSKFDTFKYWTSYRTEYDYPDNISDLTGTEKELIVRGISKVSANNINYIDDVAPFVVYKEKVPANRIILKMQTNVGDQSLGTFRIGNSYVEDPLYGDQNKTIPERWKIEILKEDSWIPIISFNELSTKSDGSSIIGSDGYVEISYGIKIPEIYQDVFVFAEEFSSTQFLPETAPIGYSYLVREQPESMGTIYIYTGTNGIPELPGWDSFIPTYGWILSDQNITRNTHVVTSLTNPDFYVENNEINFTEFEFISGIRIVVETMNTTNSTFDLIEMSPRIVADITDHVVSFNMTKTLSDLGNSPVPVGNIMASTGTLSIFDENFFFSQENIFDEDLMQGSIIAKYIDTVAKFNFYDIVKEVNGYDYYIPVKTMYSQGIPQVSDAGASASITLRDFFFFLESNKAPQMLLTNVSLSYAITVLLDNIGFSNYVFKRVSGENELIIPFFFVGPDQNVAEVLQQLAVSSQSAMFFDEYNNLVIMSKKYILPEETERSTDCVLYGQQNNDILPNIINLSSKDKKIYNGGQINYTTRYIQRSLGSISQAPYIDEYKNYIYKPALLWEVEGKEQLTTANEPASKSSGYNLAAAPLNTDLSTDIPYVINNQIKNNVIDLGQNIIWLSNYQGYLYANGEIIRYDAIEYSVQGVGNVWINSNHEYQDYFSNLTFNGKMYPTGNVRIYTEPEYETINGEARLKEGNIIKHGRGQFGTEIANHSAGLTNDTYWTNDNYVRGSIQDSQKYLFNMQSITQYPSDMSEGTAGKISNTSNGYFYADEYSKRSTRNGIIKNFLANTSLSETEINYFKTAQSGSIQSSALVFNGPIIPTGIKPADVVSYVYKELSEPFKHFGTRMRIIGKIESGTNKSQTANGSFSIIANNSTTTNNPSNEITVSGGSGGIAVGLNKDTNNGYYFEIVALSTDNVSEYNKSIDVEASSIVKSPVTQVINNLVTVTTDTQHAFNVGDYILVSGLSDDSRRTTPTTLNGEFVVSSIAQDRKSLQYTIPSPANSSTPRTISSVIGDGTKATFTTSAAHGFLAGQIINISGTSKTSFNIRYAVIDSVPSSTTFTVLTTGNIYETKFRSLTSNVATLTTTTNHSIVVGQYVSVSGIDNIFNGTYLVTGVTSNTVSFAKTNDNVDNTEMGYPYGIISVIPAETTTATGGTATYVSLNTLSSSGGTIQKNINKTTSISNIYFYKLLAGSNISEIIKKEKSAETATLTTISPHSFYPGDIINVSGIDATFNGKFTITSTTSNTISYILPGPVVPLQDLSSIGKVAGVNKIAVPQVLWKGMSNILVDDGKFTGQTRFVNTQNPTVYDLSVEYINIGTSRRFYLYLNGKQIATVDDDNPLTEYKNIALFTRGSSRCMFENVYAIAPNYANGLNTAESLQLPVSKVFGDKEIGTSEALNKYALSGFVQNTYLNGISSQSPPQYKMYFEEFGTIMREAAYFNIRYDRAYPALYAKLAETLNRVKGYAVSGFFAGSYGAEFLIFNCIDKVLNLDDTSGNFLRILGITFTQNTTYSLTVDDYLNKVSNLSDPPLDGGTLLYDPNIYKKTYDKIKQSRNKYGLNEFTIDSPYIQTTGAAEEMIGWIIEKSIKPRKTIGINTFATQNIQLGDIVSVNYKNNNDINIISDSASRYVVYNIEYGKDGLNTTSTLYLAEI